MLTANWVCRDLLETDVTEVCVWNISDKDPPDLEDSLPFVRCPYGAATRVVNLNGKNRHERAMGCKFTR
jgi:hypothetical protein